MATASVRGGFIFLTRAVCALIWAGPAAAACPPWIEQGAPPASGAETAHVAEVVDGDTVVLDSGVQVRLTGIQAPKLPLGRLNRTAWPLAADAKRALETLALRRTVRLVSLGRATDRHGRRLAQVMAERDRAGRAVWLQGEMIRLGFARVYSFRDNRDCVEGLYAREADARAARRGIWALHAYAIRTASDDLGRDLGTFQIVEGKVLRVAGGVRGVYLDFGADYRTDFSAYIGARDLRLFDEAGIDPAKLQGQTVRVRGWLSKRNGPQIEVTHPEQIELIEAQR